MISAVARLAVLASVLVAAASIPIYPGATLDVNGMKADRSHGQQSMDTVYYTLDSFDKVAAFYRKQSGIVENKALADTSAAHKSSAFALNGYNISLQWPANVYDAKGNIVAQRGTRIAYVKVD